MFSFGNKKSKLEKKYQSLLSEAYRLSQVDRKQADLKTAEAEKVREELDRLENG